MNRENERLMEEYEQMASDVSLPFAFSIMLTMIHAQVGAYIIQAVIMHTTLHALLLCRIQWNLSITDTLGPDIFDHFLLQFRDFPLSEVKNVLATPFGTKIFVLIMEVFSMESLIGGFVKRGSTVNITPNGLFVECVLM